MSNYTEYNIDYSSTDTLLHNTQSQYMYIRVRAILKYNSKSLFSASVLISSLNNKFMNSVRKYNTFHSAERYTNLCFQIPANCGDGTIIAPSFFINEKFFTWPADGFNNIFTITYTSQRGFAEFCLLNITDSTLVVEFCLLKVSFNTSCENSNSPGDLLILSRHSIEITQPSTITYYFNAIVMFIIFVSYIKFFYKEEVVMRVIHNYIKVCMSPETPID